MIALAALLLNSQVIGSNHLWPARTSERFLDTSYFAMADARPEGRALQLKLASAPVPINNQAIPYIVSAVCFFKRDNPGSTNESATNNVLIGFVRVNPDMYLYLSPTGGVKPGQVYEAGIVGKRVKPVADTISSYIKNKKAKELVDIIVRNLKSKCRW